MGFLAASKTVTGPVTSSPEAIKGVAAFRRSMKKLSDDEFAAEFVGQPDIQGDPGGAAIRVAVGFGDIFEERQEIFKRFRPDGDFLQIPADPSNFESKETVLFRESGNEKYRKFDMGFREGLKAENILSEGAADLAELLSGEIPIILGEAIAVLVAKKPGAGKKAVGAAREFIREHLLLRLAAGGAAGEATKQAAQTAADIQRQSITSQGIGVVTEAGFSMFGGILGAGLGAGVNVKAGRGIFSVTPEGVKATRAGERLGLPLPPPIQVVKSPAIKKAGRQSQALFSTLDDAIREAQEGLNAALRSRVNRKALTGFMARAEKSLERANETVMALTDSATRADLIADPKAGQALQRIVDRWWVTSGEYVDELYQAARSIEEPRFDLSDLLKTASRVRRGIRAAGKPKQEPTGLVDAFGNPYTRETSDLVQVQDQESALMEVIGVIESLDPSLPRVPGADSPVDVLRSLRRRFRDQALAPPEGARLPQALAEELRSAVNRTLQNPVNRNPAFVNAYKRADRQAAKRFDTRESSVAVELFNTDKPGELVSHLYRSGSVESLTHLSKMGGKRTLEPVRGAFKNDLIETMKRGGSVADKLKQLDTKTLNILVPSREERKALDGAAQAWQKLIDSNLPEALARQTKLRKFISTIFDNPSTSGIDGLKQVIDISGGRDSPFGESVRSAIINEVWRRSSTVDETGFRKLTSELLNSTLDEFNDRGLLAFLTVQEKRVLRNVELRQRIASVMAEDTGSSLQGGQAVSGIRKLSQDALRTFIENFSVGKIMTTDRGRRWLAQSGRATQPSDLFVYKTLGAMAGSLFGDYTAEEDPSQARAFEAIPEIQPTQAVAQ